VDDDVLYLVLQKQYITCCHILIWVPSSPSIYKTVRAGRQGQYYRTGKVKMVCVFITTVPIIILFVWGEGIVEDMCY
jgi:hypothetical protein